jgi:hypothetical protein
VYLIAARAGHVWGLDRWAERIPLLARQQYIRPLIG